MCKHGSSTVVLGKTQDFGPVAIHQCDFCGGLLPYRDVDPNVLPAALDERALAMWDKRVFGALRRELQEMARS